MSLVVVWQLVHLGQAEGGCTVVLGTIAKSVAAAQVSREAQSLLSRQAGLGGGGKCFLGYEGAKSNAGEKAVEITGSGTELFIKDLGFRSA